MTSVSEQKMKRVNITKKTSLQIANIDTTEPEFTIDIPPTTPSQKRQSLKVRQSHSQTQTPNLLQ